MGTILPHLRDRDRIRSLPLSKVKYFKILLLLALLGLIPVGLVTVALTFYSLVTQGVPTMAYLFIGMCVAVVVRGLSFFGRWTGTPSIPTLIIFALVWPLIAPLVAYNIIVTGKEKVHEHLEKRKSQASS